jgi:hypothetical protein
MKRLLIACMVLLPSLAYGLERDKRLHLTISIPFGMAGTAALSKAYPDKGPVFSLIGGTMLGTLPGLAKEFRDQQVYSGFDEKDLAADAVGAFIGALLVRGYFLWTK